MPNYTNKLSYVHKAQREAVEEPDLMLKFKLIKVLHQKFGIHSRTGPKIAIHRKYGYVKHELKKSEISDYYLHDPDVTSLKHNPPLIFEIDGDVHFLKDRAVIRTNQRNEHYEKAIVNGKHTRLIWLTDKEIENSDEMLSLILLQRFKDHGIKVELLDEQN